MAKAKAEGRSKERKPAARARAVEVTGLSAGGMSLHATANQRGIGKASGHRILSGRTQAKAA